MSDKFTMSVGQAYELAMAFGRNGWTNADVKRLSKDDMLARLLPVILGQSEVMVSELPTEMIIAGRTYEILGFLKGDEEFVNGDTMVSRAKKMNAHLGKKDCDHLLKHQDEILAALRGKIVFVFTGSRLPGGCEYFACLGWDDDHWSRDWRWFSVGWGGGFRVLRRK